MFATTPKPAHRQKSRVHYSVRYTCLPLENLQSLGDKHNYYLATNQVPFDIKTKLIMEDALNPAQMAVAIRWNQLTDNYTLDEALTLLCASKMHDPRVANWAPLRSQEHKKAIRGILRQLLNTEAVNIQRYKTLTKMVNQP